LFSLIQQVIANIPWAIHQGRVPVVYFGQRTCYWTPNNYRGRDSVWEYYFEPVVSEYPVSRIPTHVREIIAVRPPNHRDLGYFADENTFVSNNFGDHPGFAGQSVPIPYEFEDPDYSLRKMVSTIIRDHIRPRSEIIRKAELFFSANLEGRYIIGVHMRGTDALIESRRYRLGHHLDFSRYFRHLNDILCLHPDALIFAASDAESSIDRLREMFGSRVVAFQAFRHHGGSLAGKGPTGCIMPGHLTRDPDMAAKGGEDAIIDYLLLSRCNHLIHNGSSLARTVMLNVPEMSISSTVAEFAYLNRIPYYCWRWTRHLPPLFLRALPHSVKALAFATWRKM
jgi:hypothetical protein